VDLGPRTVAHVVSPNGRPFGGAYHGRKVLVTGHTGFKGTWLSLWLMRLGAEVTGYSLEPPTNPSLYEQCGLAHEMDSVHGDVNDARAVYNVVDRWQPDMVFHLAAQPLVLASYDNPVETFATNVMGTVHVLDAVRRVGSAAATVVVTTDKCYETNPTSPPLHESDRLGGKDPYSASKACAELAVHAYRSSFGFGDAGQGLATTRAGNIVGGGDWAADRIIPDCARALAGGGTLRLRHPNAVRPWQHVLDALSGYLLLGARLLERPDEYAEGWNFGPDPAQPFTVAQAVDVFAEACAARNAEWGGGATPGFTIAQDEAVTRFEQPSLRLATHKAHDRLGWAPVLDFTEAIELSADWYWRHRFEHRFDAKAATLEQINEYERRAAGKEAACA
jgi:CDP-glucose 4,6-dehydratase